MSKALVAALLAEFDEQALAELAVRLAPHLPPPAAETNDPWLDVVGAARHLGYEDKVDRGRRRVYDLVSARRLRHTKDGSRVVFRQSWLDEYLEQGGT